MSERGTAKDGSTKDVVEPQAASDPTPTQAEADAILTGATGGLLEAEGQQRSEAGKKRDEEARKKREATAGTSTDATYKTR